MENPRYKLTDGEFVAVLRAKLPTGSLARPILELFHEADGSIARVRTLEWFGSRISDEERAELLAPVEQSEFFDVTVGGDWAFYDQLDGRNIEPGRYGIYWPDGTVSEENVEVESSTTPIQDMGSVYPAPTRKAYIITDCHGSKMKTRVLGLKMRRLSHISAHEEK